MGQREMDGSKRVSKANGVLKDLEFELFVSYATGTNKSGQDNSGWVDRLYKQLKVDLQQACPNARIFFDQSELPGNVDFSRLQ